MRFTLARATICISLSIAIAASGVFAPRADARTLDERGLSSWPPLAATQGLRALVDADAKDARAALNASGATRLLDYGAFELWDVSGLTDRAVLLRDDVDVRADFNRLDVGGLSVSTLDASDDAATTLRQTRDDGGFRLVQFIGPVKAEWLRQLRAGGVEIVTYMAPNAFAVFGDAGQLAALERLAARWPVVQWTGDYLPQYRLAPELRPMASQNDAPNATVAVTVQLFRTKAVDLTLKRLQSMSSGVLASRMDVLGYTDIALELPQSALGDVAAWRDVFAVQPYVAPTRNDEAQGQILAGQLTTQGGNVVPSGPGYLNFLAAHGFSTNPSDYPIVSVTDDGVDVGVLTTTLHADFRELGLAGNPSRIAFHANCTQPGPAASVGGHGNINAGIVAGYNNAAGAPYQDANGYRLGLGISPFSRVGNTKIFDDGGNWSVENCGNTIAGIVLAAYVNGAHITSNSWGASLGGAYSADAQAYDALTRDANSNPADGNAQMLHVFSAGNSGPNAGTIGAPGTAKNVLTVGATEGVRDDGVADGCNVEDANSADDIIDFSSRGPTQDSRKKPDIVAPGTHIQGPASQADGYDGTGVCGASGADPRYYPLGQTLYTWSSGTSHSAPAATGAASLAWEYYRRALAVGQTPSPAMLKALIMNTPRYLTGVSAGDTLPSLTQGLGDVSLADMFDGAPRRLLDQSAVFSATGQTYERAGATVSSTLPFRVTLAWTDPPGPLTGNAYVNDLDLEVWVNGQRYRGNRFTNEWSSLGGSADIRNNVESVFLPPGAVGNFVVRVIAKNIAGDGVPGNGLAADQDFALVVYNAADAEVNGLVRDSGTLSPIAGALVQANVAPSQTVGARTDASGMFQLRAPAGPNVLTANAFGYVPANLAVTLTTSAPTTVVMSLSAAPRAVVSGVVSDALTGMPLPATIFLSTTPVEPPNPIYPNDPASGIYSISVAAGQPYTLAVHAALHAPITRSLGVVSANRVENFVLTPTTLSGALMGRVTSFATGAGLAGATVAVGVFTPTLTDASGNYQVMNVPPGIYTVTASLAPYESKLVAGVRVSQSLVTQLDFALNSARFGVTPTAISRTLTLGDVVTDVNAMVISNGGSAPLVWSVFESLGETAANLTAQPLLLVDGSQSAAEALATTLDELGVTYVVTNSDFYESSPVSESLAYGAVLYVGPTGSSPSGPTNQKLIGLLDLGGRLFIADNDLGYFSNGGSFYDDYLKADYLGDDACGDDLQNCVLTGADILAGISSDVMSDPFPDYFEARSGSLPILRYADGSAAGSRIVGPTYRAVYFGFDFQSLGAGSSGQSQRRAVMSRVLSWLVGDETGLPWLTISPVSGTVGVGGQAGLNVTWDASVARVPDPGKYEGKAVFQSNDPLTPTFKTSVHLTVIPGPNLGLLAGVVTGKGVCDVGASPLANATVVIGDAGQSLITRETDAQGAYAKYLPFGNYTVTVASPGYVTATRGVTVTAGMTTTSDFALTLLQSCLNASPAAISVTTQNHQVVHTMLVLTNSGAVPLSAQLIAASSITPAGGPDAFGYIYATSSSGGTQFEWIDATNGTPLNLDDDGEANVTLPFVFRYYSLATQMLRVGNNGGALIDAQTGDIGYDNTNIASALPDFVAPFWTDLDDNIGNVFVKAVGVSPNRKFVVEWFDRPRYNGIGRATFELVLFESGAIKFQYLDTVFGNPAFDFGADATSGIKGPSSAMSLQYSYNTPSLTNTLAVCFAPFAMPDCGASISVPWLSIAPSQTTQLQGGQTFTVTLDANVTGAGTSSANVFILNDSPMPVAIVPVTFTVSGYVQFVPITMR